MIQLSAPEVNRKLSLGLNVSIKSEDEDLIV
jgi:hypothetical protein